VLLAAAAAAAADWLQLVDVVMVCGLDVEVTAAVAAAAVVQMATTVADASLDVS